MNGEAGERIKSNLDAGDRRGDRDTVLVVLLLVFAFTLIILDSSFPIPKETVVKAVFSVSYVAIFMSIIYLLVNRLMPSFLPGHNAWFTEHEHGILTVVVVMASILLACWSWASSFFFSVTSSIKPSKIIAPSLFVVFRVFNLIQIL